MIIFKSKNKFSNAEGKEILTLQTELTYPDEFIQDDIDIYAIPEDKVIEPDGTIRDLRVTDLTDNIFLYEFILENKKLLRAVTIDKETINILRILDEMSALNYVSVDKHFSSNRARIVLQQFEEDKIDLEEVRNKIDSRVYELDCGIKVEHEFLAIDPSKLASNLFGVPSITSIAIGEEKNLFNTAQSVAFKEKINFLKSIIVERQEDDTYNITKVNDKNMRIEINVKSLEKSNLKVGRLGRINTAVIKGRIVKKKKILGGVYDISFKEVDENPIDALVIIPIGDYSKEYLINYFNLNYFVFCKDCIVGISYVEDIEALK